MAEKLITKEMLIPEVIGQHPSTRQVFDRYGLKGCGGPTGPRETVEFFSRAHRVDEVLLLELLNQAAEKDAREGTSGLLEFEPSLADILYRRFFKAGSLVILSAGCLLGAVILATIAAKGSFESLDLFPLIQAHGDAQVFGWIGLFVMGFAYQAFPRFKYTVLWRPEVANLTFFLMLAGVGLRLASGLVWGTGASLLLGLIGGGAIFLAVALFVLVISKTLATGQLKEMNDKFLYAALFWLTLAAASTPVVFYLLAGAPDVASLIGRVATLVGPYRDIQFLGFVTMMIFGVSLRFIPGIFGVGQPKAGWATGLFWAFNLAVAADLAFYLLLRASGRPGYALGLQASYLLILAIVLAMVWQLGIYRSSPQGERSFKFVRAAYSWLLLASLMLAVFPLYNRLTGQNFSHAFFGAYRHALTVGFISMMILGVSSKVVPVLCGKDPEKLNSLVLPFVLLNLGNGLRVGFQVLTEHTGTWSFAVMGVSGFVELAGLALWAFDLWKVMAPAKEEASALIGQPREVRPDMKVAEVLELFPETFDVFLKFGFKDIKNPILRRTAARVATLEFACRLHSVDVSQFVSALNQRVRQALLAQELPTP